MTKRSCQFSRTIVSLDKRFYLFFFLGDWFLNYFEEDETQDKNLNPSREATKPKLIHEYFAPVKPVLPVGLVDGAGRKEASGSFRTAGGSDEMRLQELSKRLEEVMKLQDTSTTLETQQETGPERKSDETKTTEKVAKPHDNVWLSTLQEKAEDIPENDAESDEANAKTKRVKETSEKVKVEIASIHNEEHIDIPEDEENEVRGDKTEARKEEDIPEKENDENPS